MEVFAEHFGIESPNLVPIEQTDGDFLVEGIDMLALKREGVIRTEPLSSVFSEAIRIMLTEADEQERVYGFLPILSDLGAWVKADFERFFYQELKSTVEKPDRYFFPEFSSINPLSAHSASHTATIGSSGERRWGIIQDKKNLEAIYDSVKDSLKRVFGPLPAVICTDNFFLTD